MNNLEEKLNRIKIKPLGEEEKATLWHKLMVKHLTEERGSKNFRSNFFSLHMKRVIAGVLSLLIILGGSGVAAANNSIPGDVLFPVELAIERAQIKIAQGDKRVALKRKFAEERISEVKSLVEKRGASSGPDTVVFSDRENNDVGVALTNVNMFLGENKDSQSTEEVRKNFSELLVVLGDGKSVKLEKKNGEIKINASRGKREAKSGNNTDDTLNKDKRGTSADIESINPGARISPTRGGDEDGDDDGSVRLKSGDSEAKEEDEEFCRGEWRSVPECDGSSDSGRSIYDEQKSKDSDKNEAEEESED